MHKHKDQRINERREDERVESSFTELAEALDVDLTLGAKENSAEELQKKLDEAVQKAKDSHEKYMRAQAEMENLRKRAERDIANAHRYSLEKFINELLPVLDSFEQGLQMSENAAADLASMREGMSLTYTMLLKAIEKFGITQLNPLEQMYDPHQHEAMSMVVATDVAPNTVIQVIQRGYSLHGRLVRPARVIITKSED